MTTLADIARVEREMHSVGGGGASCFNCQQWADTIAAYISAQRERDAATGWQPIETVPKDGTYVLLWNGGWRGVGKFHEPYDDLDPYPEFEDEHSEFITPAPIRWMHIPAAPSGTKENGDG